MVWCLFLLITPLVTAFVAPMGYEPVVAYPGQLPAYPGYVGRPIVYGQVAGDSNYYGRNLDYKNHVNDGTAINALRNSDIYVSEGGKNVAGGHAFITGDEGKQGYYKNAQGVKYTQQGKGEEGSIQQQRQSGEDGYGGYGTLGHRKGHRTSGFHKSYHNVESGKDTKYIDEDHNLGEEKYGQAYDSNFDDKAWNERGRGGDEGHFTEKVAGDAASGGAIRVGGAHDVGYDEFNNHRIYNNRNVAQRNKENVELARKISDHGLISMKDEANVVPYHVQI